MAHVLGIPSPKEAIDGSMVRKVYYEDNNLDPIIRYCEQDLITVARIVLWLQNSELSCLRKMNLFMFGNMLP